MEIKNYLKELTNDGYKVLLKKEFNNDFQNSLWHSGDIVEIKKDNISAILKAKGFIEGFLFEGGEKILQIKSEENTNHFKKDIIPFLQNDRELNEAISGLSKDFFLEIERGNWLEMDFYKDSEFICTIEDGFDLENIHTNLNLQKMNLFFEEAKKAL